MNKFKNAIIEFMKRTNEIKAYAIGTVKVVTEISLNKTYWETFEDCYYKIDSSGLTIYSIVETSPVVSARVASFRKYEYVMMVDYKARKAIKE